MLLRRALLPTRRDHNSARPVPIYEMGSPRIGVLKLAVVDVTAVALILEHAHQRPWNGVEMLLPGSDDGILPGWLLPDWS